MDTLSIPGELIEAINRGQCVLFVGSQLDESGDTDARLAAALVDACGAHSDCVIDECRKIGRCHSPNDCKVPFGQAAQLFESKWGRHSLVSFVRQWIQKYVEPSPTFDTLVRLPFRVIVTTRYDDCLEALLGRVGRSVLPVLRDTDIPYDDPDRVQLIRLRGTISQLDTLILTEDDAADLYSPFKSTTKIVLQAHIATKTLFFAGYDLNDPYFKSLYKQTTESIARHRRRSYAVQWPPSNDLIQAYWKGKNFHFLQTEPVLLLQQLARMVRSQSVERKLPALPQEPYKYLDFFTKDDVRIFFGRELEAEILLCRVLSHKLTILYGRSGAGKTSLLRAGALPRLEAEGYRVLYTRALIDPALAIKATAQGVPPEQLSPNAETQSLHDVLVNTLTNNEGLVVVIDQFEDLFTRQGPQVCEDFAKDLAKCIADENYDLRFILALRDDFLLKLDELAGHVKLDELAGHLTPDILTFRYRLSGLDRDRALLAIRRPADLFHIPIEESLADTLSADLIKDISSKDMELLQPQIEPPQLQIVCHKLWEHWRKLGEDNSRGITLAQYQNLGGLSKILADYLDSELETLGDPERILQAKAILKSMVTAERTKAARTAPEIAQGELVARLGLDDSQVAAILGHLRERRILRKLGETDQYELAHEVMIERIKKWISQEEWDLVEVRDELRQAIDSYSRSGGLLSKAQLKLVWSHKHHLKFSEKDTELLLHSSLAWGSESAVYWLGRIGETEEIDKVKEVLVEWVVNKIVRKTLLGEDKRIRENARTALRGARGETKTKQIKELISALTGELKNASERTHRRQAALALWQLREHLNQSTRLKVLLPVFWEWGFRPTSLFFGSAAFISLLIAIWYFAPVFLTPKPALEWIAIASGSFEMGNNDGTQNEKPRHWVDEDSFEVAKFEITNADYALCVQARQCAKPDSTNYSNQAYSHHPVVGVNWFEAQAFCGWVGARLPSEAEWEKAATWNAQLNVKQIRVENANTFEDGPGDTTAVGSYPDSQSPAGLMDTAGNVWEWTSSLLKPYPYDRRDGREDLQAKGERVARGGSFLNLKQVASGTNRVGFDPAARARDLGFRCARSK
jgi:formylglycine-generating enzyme required for sulfatase activity